MITDAKRPKPRASRRRHTRAKAQHWEERSSCIDGVRIGSPIHSSENRFPPYECLRRTVWMFRPRSRQGLAHLKNRETLSHCRTTKDLSFVYGKEGGGFVVLLIVFVTPLAALHSASQLVVRMCPLKLRLPVEILVLSVLLPYTGYPDYPQRFILRTVRSDSINTAMSIAEKPCTGKCPLAIGCSSQ